MGQLAPVLSAVVCMYDATQNILTWTTTAVSRHIVSYPGIFRPVSGTGECLTMVKPSYTGVRTSGLFCGTDADWCLSSGRSPTV